MGIDVRKMSLLQKEQVELGLQHGLSLGQVRLFAKSCYNHRKMAEMRRELEVTGKLQRCPKKGWIWGLFVSLVMIGVLGFWYGQRPVLVLRQRECVIEQGEAFDAMTYVEQFTNRRGVLELPKIDTSQEGEVLAVYRLHYGHEYIVRTMRVIIKNTDKE